MSKIGFCQSCHRQVVGSQPEYGIETVEKDYQCALCFGILNAEFITQVSNQVGTYLEESQYDASSFILALSLPGSQMLREEIIRKRFPNFNGTLESVPFKIRNINAYLSELSKASGLKPTLASDLQLTITFENDEFDEYDKKFLMSAFPKDFMQQGRKRRCNDDDDKTVKKVQLMPFFSRITEEMAKKYNLQPPSKSCTFSISCERDPVYIAGRYCKFSRALPQSPWSMDEEVQPIKGNSVTEVVCDVLQDEFGADSYRFVASGREDVDVRMLGNGRPFCVHLINCRRTNKLKGFEHIETLKRLEEKINRNVDVKVNSLSRVTRAEGEILSYGQDDKRKVYNAYCYSVAPLTNEAIAAAQANSPIKIIQKTPVRVLKRRALLDRPRFIYKLEIVQLNDHHFNLRIETQAGTYVKEFVHGDFGRTRPSLGELMKLPLGKTVGLLELDVDEILFDWPPERKEPYFFK